MGGMGRGGWGGGSRSAAGDLTRNDYAGAWKRRDMSESAIKIFKLEGPKLY